jgi:hypothetical protein
MAGIGKWVASKTGSKFQLPVDHTPYMVLSKGGTGPFSCAGCSMHEAKGDEHHCSSPLYKKFMGDTLLVDEKGKPLDDPSRACSDWFKEK